MEKVYVVWSGTGGELERREATAETAAQVLTDMVSNTPMSVGDTITIESAE